MRRRLVALTTVPLVLFGATACGDDSADSSTEASNVDMGDSIPGVEVTGAFGEAPKVKIDSPLKVDKTQSEVITAGEGNEVVAGEQALLGLYLANGTTGDKAAATYDQGVPFHVQEMSEGQLWPAVLDSVVGKPVGSRVTIASTPEEAYGDAGNPQMKIGAKDPVVFVVDVLSVEPTDALDGPEGNDAADVPQDLPIVEEKNGVVSGLNFDAASKKPSDELQVVPLVEGDGPVARDDSLVTFDYLGQVYGSDKVFDESYSKEPVTFPLGAGGLIKGWDEGLVGLKEGTRVLIITPPDFGYGEKGSPPNIPGGATLGFVIDILGVDEAS